MRTWECGQGHPEWPWDCKSEPLGLSSNSSLGSCVTSLILLTSLSHNILTYKLWKGLSPVFQGSCEHKSDHAILERKKTKNKKQQTEVHVKMEAETVEMYLQVEEPQGWPTVSP